MALAQVKKINLIYNQKHNERILELIQNTGWTQIEDSVTTDDNFLNKVKNYEAVADMDYQLAGIKFALDFLAVYGINHKIKKSWAEKLNAKIFLNHQELSKVVADFDHQSVVSEVQELEKEYNQANNIIDKAQSDISLLTPWTGLSFAPNVKNLPVGYSYGFFIVSEKHRLALLSTLNQQAPLSAAQEVGSDSGEIRLSIIFKQADESVVREIISSFEGQEVELIEIDSSISGYLLAQEQVIVQAQSQLDKLDKKITKTAKHDRDLKIMFDYLTWQRDKLAIQQKMAASEKLAVLTLWVDGSKWDVLEKELSKISPEFVVAEAEILADESIPIIFKNSWAKPFEAVTNVYGAPQYNEPDPTPFLAPFFILFFGLCLTDAGYGIVLAVMAWLAIKVLKVPKEGQKMYKVLMYGGVVTFIAGALVGGWFGIIIDNIKITWLREILVSIRLINPVQEPIKMLIFALSLGVIQVLTGIAISIYWNVRNKNFMSALLDDALWFYFLVAILFWGATQVGLVAFAGAVYFVWIGLVGLILTQGRHAKNPLLKLGGGVLSLYGLIGYLSDVLSYSRLLALGLATGIIAMVINLIAALTIDMVPYVGWLLAIIILIGGHIFNVAINTLGAFIHSSRLQFVEFFPKFMKIGGGKVFQPFAKQGQYIRIIK